MNIYLVKSSYQTEEGEDFWENLQVFISLKLAKKFATKVRKLIKEDKSKDKVVIQTFILNTDD